jgi:AraC family transcriptional regulator of adaptative response/methylated-DNA-[protein]-cysteine methyltransferase
VTQFPDDSDSQYAIVEEAIAYLRAHHRQQPGLTLLAAHLNLSESHLQKLFSRWAGISPKRFLQFLTVEYAKQRMTETRDLLSLSLDAGLSGPSRLHDLFISMEAMSPGEFKRAAKGVRVLYGLADTPFGKALVARTPRGLCHLSFSQKSDLSQAGDQLWRLLPSAHLEHDPAGSKVVIDQIFAPGVNKAGESLSLWVSGTNFQIQVWRALIQIPPAGLLNYQQVAGFLGAPKAFRAVASAIAKNPIAYLIPCHRVLRKTGEFGEYHWGAGRKAAIHVWEVGQQASSSCDQ